MIRSTRRQFLQTTATLAATSSTLAIHADSPNEKITLAVIGCGPQGGSFCDSAQFVCDPDRSRLNAIVAKHKIPEANAVSDFRRLLDRKEIDAVVIATPDHWHVPAAIMAANAGKHVYLEKPCAQNFRELQILKQVIEKQNVVFQHGTNFRSTNLIAGSIKLLRDGTIGDVLMARAWNIQKRNNIGNLKPGTPPPEVDYDLWVGPAEMLPFQQNRFHYNWRWWYNFGTGDIGNDGAHEMDIARWGLGVSTLPDNINVTGGKYYFNDDQQYPDTASCAFEWKGDGNPGSLRQLVFDLRLWSTNYPYNVDSGVEFFGTEGQLFVSKRGKFQLLDAHNKRREDVSPTANVEGSHLQDFFASIREPSRQTRTDINEAFQTTALLLLANASARFGKPLGFDPITQNAATDEANALLTRTYRQEGHWAIPQV